VYKNLSVSQRSALSIVIIISNIQLLQSIVWERYFNLDHPAFKYKIGYSFGFNIQTNGVGASILFIKTELIGLNFTERKKKISNNAKDFAKPRDSNQASIYLPSTLCR